MKRVKKAASKTTKATKAKVATNPLKDVKARYPHVKAVIALGVKGQAVRVVIECTEPKCKQTREIATQDAFQVKRCMEHQREYAKSKRRKVPVEA